MSKITLKKSSVTGKTPLTTDLDYGELALNYADGTLFYKRSDNTIQSLLSSGGGGGGGAGTVTSVGISVPTGLDVSNTPITSSGTMSISLASGYSIPTTANQTNWNTAYSWGNHASAGYQTSLVSGTSIKTLNGNSLIGEGSISLAEMSYPLALSTWTRQTAAGTAVWDKICGSYDGSTLYSTVFAFGSSYDIRKSTDGGATWSQLTSAGLRSWGKIQCSLDGTVLLAIVSASQAWRSLNSGADWTLVTIGGTDAKTGIAIPYDTESFGKFVVSGNAIYRSTDYGSTWTTYYPVYTSSNSINYSSVCTNSDGQKIVTCATNRAIDGVVYSGGGYLHRSTDGGSTWTQLTAAGMRIWTQVACSSDGSRIYATVNNGSLYVSNDSGTSWKLVKVYSGQKFGISNDGRNIVILSTGNEVAQSSDYGKTWQTLVPTEPANIAIVGGYASNEIFVSGDGKTFTVTVAGNYVVTNTSALSIPVIKGGNWDTSLLVSSLQPTLVSGTNIKTINGTSLLGAGNISIDSIDTSSFLTISSAASTYLTQSSAASTYLTQSSAASTYLTQSSAASTYLTQSSAASTYQPLSTNLTSWSSTTTSSKQDTLVSGTNIKTINGTSLLGSGNIEITSGGSVSTTGSFGITIDGGGSAITTGTKGYIAIPYNCTITGWTIISDVNGSIVVDVWKDTYANYPPTSGDSITGTEKPTLSSAIKNQDLSLTTWSTSVSAGDVIGFSVESATSVTRVHVIINVTKG